MSKANKDSKERLDHWQKLLEQDETAYKRFSDKFDHREELYFGSRALKPVVDNDAKRTTPHVRNVISELIEAQIDPTVPQPKVNGHTQEQEYLAKVVEDKIRNELDRMPMEAANDMAERIVRIQGGVLYMAEWDSSAGDHEHTGDIVVTALHPKQIIPQAGIYTGFSDMDHYFVKRATTKTYIKRRYDIDVEDEAEENPEIRETDAESVPGLVTLITAFFKGENSGIGCYTWVNDTEIEYLEDYQARRLPRCKKCGELWTADFEPMGAPMMDGMLPETPEAPEPKKAQKDVCPYCGSKSFEDTTEQYEEIWQPRKLRSGVELPGAQIQSVVGEDGMLYGELIPTKIPFYKPDIFPIALLRNVSVYGQLLGESDADRIEDQQNTINRLSAKILDILLKSGSYAVIPEDAAIELNGEDMKPWRARPEDAGIFNVVEMTADISQIVEFRERVYEEARQQLGITDSYQGRRDTTAQSGIAKQFSAQQAEGRLLSKRVAKAAGWSELFEIMFKFLLAYADEARPVVGSGTNGEPEYGVFDRYEFLKQDGSGEWYWDDNLLFSVDDSAPLISNRSAMWQEVTAFYQAGAFGDPTNTETQILFWEKMTVLHYPGAAETKKYLEEKMKREQQAAQAAAQEQQAVMQSQMSMEKDKQQYETKRQARQDAEKTAQMLDNKLMGSQGGGDMR